MTTDKYWEHLMQEIQPLLCIGKELAERLAPLPESNEQTTEDDRDKMDNGMQEEVMQILNESVMRIGEVSSLSCLLGKKETFLAAFEQLDALLHRLARNDASARQFIQELMQEVITTSIDNRILTLEEWGFIIKERTETMRTANAAEYAYKQVFHRLNKPCTLSVYDFFYNKTPTTDIDHLLKEAKEKLSFASECRQRTQKRGQGLSRCIVDYIHTWQDQGLMKPLKAAYPFCECLQKHWGNAINLGSRQGIEVIYKQRG